MGKKRLAGNDPGALAFLGRLLLSATVTAGVVGLFRDVWSGPGRTRQPEILEARPLPTLAPAPVSLETRVLKHVNGLCVLPEGETGTARLVLSECSGELMLLLVGDGESVRLQAGSDRCAVVAQGRDVVFVLGDSVGSCGRHASFRKLLVGTDLFLLEHLETRQCLSPLDDSERPLDGTYLTLQDCSPGRASLRFQTSRAQSRAVPLETREYSQRVATLDHVERVDMPSAPAPTPRLQGPPTPTNPQAADTTLVHLSGMCVKAQDDVTGEDSTVLVFSDCADEPGKNLHFSEVEGTYRFQLGRQCAHPDDGAEASSEPRLSFPADCSSKRHILSFQKLAEDEQLPGFLIQSVGGAVQYCIHPYQGSESPSDGTELINHIQCDRGRRALRFRVGDPETLSREEPKLKKALGNPLIPVPTEEPCSYYGEGRSQSSRPGKPCLPPPPFWPYTGLTEWRTELGRRALAAVTPTDDVSEAKCGGYYLLGDQTWCNRAFDGSHGHGQLGLSFGIEERDIWGELVTQKFGLPVHLFDCYIPLERSPPMSGTAPNNSATCAKNHLGEPKLDPICYGASYYPHRSCLAGQDVVVEKRHFVTLEEQLRGWPKLSLHLKIDVEGSEWDVLEWLIEHPAEWDKVRTLDMEIHFGFGSAAELPQYKALGLQEKLTRQVSIMEGLRKRFFCTGSTLEVYRQGWSPQDNCGVQPCGEPPVYLPNGFSVTAFAVSYVHKEIVGVSAN